MVLQLTVAAEVRVNEGADAGGPVGEPPHHGGPGPSSHVQYTKPVLELTDLLTLLSLSTNFVTWVVFPDLSQPSNTIKAPLLIADVIL